MVKLYNKSRCPDEILKRLIGAAGRRIGARSAVVVKVTQSQRGHQHGCAKPGVPYLWHLARKRKGVQRYRMIDTDGGWIELQLPIIHRAYDHLEQAESFYRLCLHEWGHIKEYQENADRTASHRFSDYNRRWKNRPHERRACRIATEAGERYYSKTAEQAILELALWLEEMALQ